MPTVHRQHLHGDLLKDGTVSAEKLEDGAVGADAIANNVLTGNKVDAGALDSTNVFAIPIVLRRTIAAATADTDITMPYKAEVIAVQAVKEAANGGAGDSITVKNGANAITNSLDLNTSTDGQVVGASQINPAYRVLDAAATLRISAANSTNCSCVVQIWFVRRD
jgi:hypothetical protein